MMCDLREYEVSRLGYQSGSCGRYGRLFRMEALRSETDVAYARTESLIKAQELDSLKPRCGSRQT